MLCDVRGNTRAIVLNFDLNLAINMTQTDPHPPLPVDAVGYGLDRIANQIDQYLFDLDMISGDIGQGGRIYPDSHPLSSSFVGKHADYFVRSLHKIDRTPSGLTFPQEV